MPTAVRAYYDGTQVVVAEQDRARLIAGDHLIITVLNRSETADMSALAERRLRILEEEKYMRPSKRTVEEIDRYIDAMRNEERL